MSQTARSIPSELSQRTIDAPTIDFLSQEDDGSYLVTFVPQDSVSHQDKETVLIGRSSPEGHRIASHLSHIGAAVGASGSIVRVSHAGGADFTFHFSPTGSTSLSRAHPLPPRCSRGFWTISSTSPSPASLRSSSHSVIRPREP